MPIEIQYSDDKKGVIFCAVGKVTGNDIIKKQTSIYNDSRFIDLEYWIVDRSKCTDYIVTADEVIRIAEIDNEAAKTNPNLLVALVAETIYQYGISRMYEAHIDEGGFKTMVFQSMNEAVKWINSELSK